MTDARDVVVGNAPEPVRRPPLLSAAGWSVVTGVITTLAGLVTSIVVARLLGPVLMGEYRYWMWLVGVLPMFFGFGLAQATLKFAAQLLADGQRDLAASVVRALLKVAVAISPVAAITLLVVGLASGATSYFAICALLVVPIVFGAATAVLGNAVRGALDYRFTTVLAALLNGVQVILFLIVLGAGGGLSGLLTVMVASTAGSLVLRWLGRVYGRGRCRIPTALRDAITKYCRSLTGLSLLDAVAGSRSEVFLLRLFAATDQIAFYSLAYGISGRLIMAATLITHPMVPALSALHALNDSRRMGCVRQGEGTRGRV